MNQDSMFSKNKRYQYFIEMRMSENNKIFNNRRSKLNRCFQIFKTNRTDTNNAKYRKRHSYERIGLPV